jgi:hypothetical protein
MSRAPKLHPIHADRWLAGANDSFSWTTDKGVVTHRLRTVDCGDLWLESGRLVPCDPFVTLQANGNVEVAVPPGRYPVRVTIADVSEQQDGTHDREAYLSLILADEPAAGWRFLQPRLAGAPEEPMGEDEFVGIGVDAGTVAFVDASAVERLMPASNWYEELFDSDEDDSWFARMDDPAHIRNGCANIALPGATGGENLILSHSGWGDGFYAVIGTYTADGRLTGVHIDLAVLPVAPLPEWDE